MTKEEILALAGEPIGYLMPHYAEYPDVFMRHPLPKGYSAMLAAAVLYTESQLLAATKPLEEENQRLRMALADTEALEIGTGERCEQLRRQLAAAQAREQQYRDAIVKAGIAWSIGEPYSRNYFEQAIAQPQDISALEAMIAKAGEVMREKCAVTTWNHYADTCIKKGINPHHFGEWISSASIRALPGVTLKDIL